MLQAARVRHPLIQEHERLLGLVRRPPAEHSRLGQIVDEAIAALARRGDALLLPESHQLGSSDAAASRDRVDDDLVRQPEVPLIELEPAMPEGESGEHPLGRDLQHPAEIFRRDEMQCAAHRPGADDPARVEVRQHVILRRAGSTDAESPASGAEILCRNGQHPPHDRLGCDLARSLETVGERSQSEQVVRTVPWHATSIQY